MHQRTCGAPRAPTRPGDTGPVLRRGIPCLQQLGSRTRVEFRRLRAPPPRFSSTHCLAAAAGRTGAGTVPRRPRAHSSRLDEPRQAAAASPQPVRFQELRKKRWPAGRAGGGAVALLRAMIVGLPGTRRWSRACGQGRPRSEPEAEASCSPAFTPSAFNAGSRDCTV